MKLSFLFSKLVKRVHIPAIRNSRIDKTARICSGSHIVNITLDKYSYIGNFCTVLDSEIGRFTSIADNCIIGGASHPIDWVSTSPVFHEGKNVMRKNFSSHEYAPGKKTTIGNDVWIGNNCLIKSGVKIGNGAVLGMGSVLTKNVGDYEIWGGNPAQLIRKRFDTETIKELVAIDWWNWDEETIKKAAVYFNCIEKFLKYFTMGE